jgi:hypothetical protein
MSRDTLRPGADRSVVRDGGRPVGVAVFASETVNKGLHALEISFLALLGLMGALITLIAMVVVVRLVEPRGARALLRKLAGKPL